MTSKPHSDPFEEIREIGRVLEAMWPDDHRSASYVKALSDKLQRLEEQLEAAHDEAAAYQKQSSEQADEARKWRARADVAENFVEACAEIVSRSRDPLVEITARLTDLLVACPNCGGSGEDMNWLAGSPVPCRRCDGRGEVSSPAEKLAPGYGVKSVLDEINSYPAKERQ